MTQFKFLHAPVNYEKTCKNFSASYFYSLFNSEETPQPSQIQQNKNIHSASRKSQPPDFLELKITDVV